MKRPLTAQEQGFRIQGRRRIIGAFVMMMAVVAFLPMILDHATGPKFSLPDSAVPPPAATAARPEPPPVAVLPQSEPAVPATEPAAGPGEGAAEEDSVPPVASSRGKVFVQAGVFSDHGKAEALMQKLVSKGFRAFSEPVHFKDGDRTRIRLGPFASRAEAQDMLHRLDQQGIHSMVVQP